MALTTVITVCHNSSKTIRDTIDSVVMQSVPVMHLFKDGGSSDSTVNIISSSIHPFKLVEGKDDGIYDAMGIALNLVDTPYFVFLNSDDYFVSAEIVEAVEQEFSRSSADAVMCGIQMVNKEGRVVRKWLAKSLSRINVFTPQIAHPGLFVRTAFVRSKGISIDPDLRIAADLKFQLQLMEQGAIFTRLNVISTTMRMGGASTSSFRSMSLGWLESFRVYNEVVGHGGLLFTFFKVIRKLLDVRLK